MAIEAAGYKVGEQIGIALDAATAKCLKMVNTDFIRVAVGEISSDEMVAYWTEWVNKYPIISIEDGMAKKIGTDGKN